MKKFISAIFALFALVSLSAAAQTVSFTAELMTGLGYQANIYVGNDTYDFYTNPRDITVSASDDIFITHGYGVDSFYEVTVDGKTVPQSLWDLNSTYDATGFTLTPGSEYYPADGGRIEVYVDAPVTSEYAVKFNFTNAGTEGFVEYITIGYVNYFKDSDEYQQTLAGGLMLAPGTRFAVRFDTADYSVASISLNGDNLGGAASLTEWSTESLDSDLTFSFDVDLKKGNTINYTVDGPFEGVVITDRNDSSNTFSLNAASGSLELPASVSEIKITAADGYEIAENGISYTYPSGTTEETSQGSFFEVVDGMDLSISIARAADPNQRVLTFYCEADVLYFEGIDADYKPAKPTVQWTAPAAEGELGFYSVTNVPVTALSLYVNEADRAEYVLSHIVYEGQNLSTYDNGVSVSVPVRQVSGNAEFTVVFKKEVKARNITIEVNNPTCISRIYNNNWTMSSGMFPCEYDLNNGLTLTVELRANCSLRSVTCNGQSILTDGDVINLGGVDAGDVVYIDAVTDTGDFTYTFIGEEGLVITYRGLAAPYDYPAYTVANVYASDLGNYPLYISVGDEYANRIVLRQVTDGTSVWEPVGASNQIIIPGSELPAADTRFVITVSTADPSETVRTVYLTVDNISAVMYSLYQGGSNEYFSFVPTGEGNQGVATLTISPQQYTVQIVTSKSVKNITASAENTFVMPELPSTNVVLNLLNALEGETISLVTDDSDGIADVTVAADGNAPVYNLQGIRVDGPLSPGLYIVGGKKVFVR